MIARSTRSRLLRSCLLFAATACSSGEQAGGDGELLGGQVAVALGVAGTDAVVLGRDGSWLVARSTGEGTVLTLGSGDGEETIWLDESGNPSRVVARDVIVTFANWTATSVDVAIIRPSGELDIRRGVVLPPSIRELRLAGSRLADARALDLEGIGRAAALASCGVAVLNLPVTVGATWGFTLALCSVAAAQFEQYVRGIPQDDVSRSIDAITPYLDALQCGAGDPTACVEFTIAIAEAVDVLAQQLLSRREPELRTAEGVLDAGSGDIQVTLGWRGDGSTDLDLRVTEPGGFETSYQQRRSPSGGQLDRDDTCCGGPENIFWPAGGAPPGRYSVAVDYFSGRSPATYVVQVTAGAFSKSYTGTISGGRVNVVTFELGRPLPIAVPTAMHGRPGAAINRSPKATAGGDHPQLGARPIDSSARK